jgi:hypothetical protein
MLHLKGLGGRIVMNFPTNFGFLRLRSHCPADKSIFLIRALILLLLGLVGAGSATRANASNPPGGSPGPGSQFAISDFDGDRRPDIASIQPTPNGPGRTNYWIQLQLSAAGRQFIRISGPAGGLQIEARDINGDDAVDLIVSTAWYRQPVAIFLNDGHGSFTQTDPDSFPGAFSGSRESCSAVTHLSVDAVGVPPQSGAGICPGARAPTRFQWHAGSISPETSGFLHRFFLLSNAGRAPPFALPHC